MHTKAELEAKATKSERWLRPVFVVQILLALINLALWERRASRSALMSYLLEHGWPASTGLFAQMALVATSVAYFWLDWRISRLADAIARARTVASITGNPNPRVGVLGESDPHLDK